MQLRRVNTSSKRHGRKTMTVVRRRRKIFERSRKTKYSPKRLMIKTRKDLNLKNFLGLKKKLKTLPKRKTRKTKEMIQHLTIPKRKLKNQGRRRLREKKVKQRIKQR